MENREVEETNGAGKHFLIWIGIWALALLMLLPR